MRLITLVKKLKSKDWDWSALLANKNIKTHDILDNLDLPWKVFNNIIEHRFKFSYILNNQHIEYFDIELVNDQRCFDIMYGEPFSIPLYDNKWDMIAISLNPRININMVLKNKINWNFYFLSMNGAILMKDVKNNLNLPWNFKAMSQNPSITYIDIFLNPDFDWCYKCLSKK